MQRISKNAIFNYEISDEEIVLVLADYLDQNANEIYSFFGINSNIEKPIINIIETKQEFDNIYCKINNLTDSSNIPKWLVGSSNKNMQIYYLSLNDYKNTSHNVNIDNYKKTILHEFIHYVNRYFCKLNNCEYSINFLAEGIAEYLSNQVIDTKLAFSYSLDDILNSNNCYKGWYLITKYIIENYQHDYLIELLNNRELAITFIKNNYYEIKNYYQNIVK